MAAHLAFRSCYILFIFIYVLHTGYSATYNILYETPTECLTTSDTEYNYFFDISQLTCLRCSQTKVIQTVSSDGLNCICQPGYRIIRDYGGASITCEACPAGTVPSSDGWDCMACDTSIDPVNQVCVECQTDALDPTVPNNEIAVERDLSGVWPGGTPTRTCTACANSTAPNADKTQCLRCNQVLSVLGGQYDCQCPDLQTANGLCFQSADDINFGTQQLYKVTFGQSTFDSAYFVDNIRAAAGMCSEVYNNLTACQELGNLCALSMYSKEFEGQIGNEDACSIYLQYAQGSAGQTTQDWPPNMPWLYYLEDPADDVLSDEGIPIQFNMAQSTLPFKAAVYSLNGSFQGYSDVTDGLLQLCSNTENILDAAFKFGQFYEQECEITLAKFWDEEAYPLNFMDIYLQFEDSGSKLYAIPLKILNYEDSNGNAVNRRPDPADWELVRRLFLVDNISGKTADTVEYGSQSIRYAKSIRIEVELQRDTSDGLIYPPYIEVEYGVATAEDFDSNRKDTITFSVNYKMDLTQHDYDLTVAIGVLAALTAVYSGLQTWGWARRAGRIAIDFVVIVKFLLFSFGNLANIFFVVLLGSSLWWVIMYKRQENAYIVVPNQDQEGPFVAFLAAALVLKFFQLLHLLVCQVTVDIFFLDWERPRGKVMTSNDAQQKGQEAPVSIWRTYFVANEWNEIQTTRKINATLQIFSVILFLNVIGFGNLATKDPWSRFTVEEDVYYSPQSRIFRFGISALTYLILAVVQWVFFTFIYERFIEDKVAQYVDLCSLSNVSVFILETGQFGYYIHGRSVHGRADTGMKEMHENLKREEESLCGQRGLMPNTDQQTFNIAIQTKLRHQYDRVMGPISADRVAAGQGRTTSGQSAAGAGHIDAHTEKSIQAYGVLNRFLQAFVDHSLKDIDYIVKDRTFMENVLNMEFTDPVEHGFFYNDRGRSFDKVLFYGHENTLTLFEILFFCIVDLVSQNYVLSAVITYAFMQIILAIRDGLGRANLAKKTLVDKRFLI